MQNINDILNELKEISPVLAEIPRQKELYQLPPGYFETLPDKIFSRIRNAVSSETASLSTILSQADKKPVFDIPADYFETFSSRLLVRIKAEQAGTAKEELEILSPLLDQIGKKTAFSTPAGYFNELPASLAAGIQAVAFVNDELESENLSPLMRGLRNKNVYETPVGYFEKLPEILLHKIRNRPEPAKVISFRKSWLKYAVAAAVTGLILTVGIFTFNKPHSAVATDPLTGLTTVSDQEITNYLENQDLLLAETAANSTAILDFNDNDVKDLMSEVSDDELQQYANENAGSKEPVTN
jgi:adenylate kinase